MENKKKTLKREEQRWIQTCGLWDRRASIIPVTERKACLKGQNQLFAKVKG